MIFFNVNLLFTNETVFIFLLALLFIFYQHLNSLILNFSIFYVSSGSSDEGSPKPLPRSSSLGDRDRPMTSRQAMGIFDEDDLPVSSSQSLDSESTKLKSFVSGVLKRRREDSDLGSPFPKRIRLDSGAEIKVVSKSDLSPKLTSSPQNVSSSTPSDSLNVNPGTGATLSTPSTLESPISQG